MIVCLCRLQESRSDDLDDVVDGALSAAKSGDVEHLCSVAVDLAVKLKSLQKERLVRTERRWWWCYYYYCCRTIARRGTNERAAEGAMFVPLSLACIAGAGTRFEGSLCCGQVPRGWNGKALMRRDFARRAWFSPVWRCPSCMTVALHSLPFMCDFCSSGECCCSPRAPRLIPVVR